MAYLKVNIKYTTLDFDKGNYEKKLFDILETQNRIAARAWLRAVILRVPVFTGSSRGSLKPLGEYLHVAIPIRPVAQRKGEGPEVGAVQSFFRFSRGYITEFEFAEAVYQYVQNEVHDWNPPIHLTHLPRPWRSFEQGKLAYRNYLKKYLKDKLPSITKYTLRGTMYVKS